MLGSLSTLSALESEASERQKREAKTRSLQRDRHQQSEKIQQLQQRRDELKQMLHDKTISQAAEGSGKRGDGEATDEVTSALAYVAELREKLQVYKMTGVSVVKTDQDSKVLCFNTSYRGVYLESYHLKLQRLTSGHFKVVHHDLPPFIAYSALPGNMEVKDMLSAVRPVQEALTMFVQRREELKEAQSKFTGSLHVIESSAAVDYLCCSLDISAIVQVQITLKYANLNNYLPSSVQAVLFRRGDGKRRVKESLPQDIVHSLHSDFCSQHLNMALSRTMQLLQGYLYTHYPQSPDDH